MALRRAAHATLQVLAAELVDLDLTPSEINALANLANGRGRTVSELGAAVGIRPTPPTRVPAWLAVRRYGMPAAIRLVSVGIRRTARYAGAPQKYHETISRAWVELVAHHAIGHPAPARDAGHPARSAGHPARSAGHPAGQEADF